MARPSTFRVLLRHLPLLRPMPMVLPFMARFTGHVFIGYPERRQSGADGAGVNWLFAFWGVGGGVGMGSGPAR